MNIKLFVGPYVAPDAFPFRNERTHPVFEDADIGRRYVDLDGGAGSQFFPLRAELN